MAKLSTDWLFESHIDLEYKSYVLLAYLKEVSNAFEINRLYPYLADLVAHYNGLLNIRSEHERLEEAFPKNLRSIRPNFQLEYEKMGHPESLQEVIEIIEYSIPLLKKHLPIKPGDYGFYVGNVPLAVGRPMGEAGIQTTGQFVLGKFIVE